MCGSLSVGSSGEWVNKRDYSHQPGKKEMEQCLLLLQHIPLAKETNLRQQALQALEGILLSQPHALIPQLTPSLIQLYGSLHIADKLWIAQFPEAIYSLSRKRLL